MHKTDSGGDGSAPWGSAPLEVLLVEDSPYLALRIRELIEQAGRPTRVATVDTEDAAVAALAARPPRLVILDLHLKAGTGFGVLAAMASRGGERPVVAVLTNFATPLYERAARMHDVAYFLDKSRDFDQLAAIIQAVP